MGVTVKRNVEELTEVGMACVYCGTLTEDACCGEVHHELAYETDDGEIILESDVVIDPYCSWCHATSKKQCQCVTDK